MSEEKEQEFSSDELENEEQGSQEEPSTGSSETPDKDQKIKELEGQKNYYQKKYKELKEKGASQESQEQTSGSIEEVREEMKLYALGKDEEEVNQLKAIAQGKGISLSEAREDPLYKAYEQSKEQESQSEKAQLGASTGSPESGGTPTNRDEHKKRFEELKKQYGG